MNLSELSPRDVVDRFVMDTMRVDLESEISLLRTRNEHLRSELVEAEEKAKAAEMSKALSRSFTSSSFPASQAAPARPLDQEPLVIDLRATIEKDSAERSQMMALLRLNQVEEEAKEEVGMAQQQSIELQKTTQQAERERELAQMTAQQAKEDKSRAEEATTVEMKKRMLTTAQTMSIKAMQTEDKTLQGLLAYQAYKFNIQYSGPENQPASIIAQWSRCESLLKAPSPKTRSMTSGRMTLRGSYGASLCSSQDPSSSRFGKIRRCFGVARSGVAAKVCTGRVAATAAITEADKKRRLFNISHSPWRAR